MSTTVIPESKDLAAIIQAGGRGRKSRFRIVIVLAVFIVGLAGWLLWGRAAKTNSQGAQFATEPLRRGDLSLTITATGNLEPTNKVTIGSELSGTTLEVYVDTNDQVTKGEPLAKLDTHKLAQQTERSRASLNSAKARVNQAQATLKESEASLGRQQTLYRLSGGKAPSKAEMDTAIAVAERARADVASAEAVVAEAEAEVKANETDLAKAMIRSPIDGIVLSRSLEPGQTVAASFTAPELFVIAENLSQMKLKVAVAEADIGRVAKGQKATFTVDAWPDRSYTADVTKVEFGSAVTDNVVTYETELQVSNDDLSLRPGMTATANIRVAEAKGVMLVPAAALRFDPSASRGPAAGAAGPPKKTFVQTLMPGPSRRGTRPRPAADGENRPARRASGSARIWVLRDGKPESIPVKTGLSDGRHTEVSGEGLSEGLPVILRAITPAS